MGDSIINLLNSKSSWETTDFLNNMHSNSLVFYITLPTCIKPRSKTLIDNMFFNEINEPAISGNLVIDISDHHAKFLITPRILENDPIKWHSEDSLKTLTMSFSKKTF